jgi:hypothetical protein
MAMKVTECSLLLLAMLDKLSADQLYGEPAATLISK